MPYIDIRVSFDIKEEDDDYRFYLPTKAELINSDLDEGECESIAETAGQSDSYQVGVANAMLLAFGGGSYPCE